MKGNNCLSGTSCFLLPPVDSPSVRGSTTDSRAFRAVTLPVSICLLYSSKLRYISKRQILTKAIVSWTGMFYLTLFLCSKFSVTIPYLLPYSFSSASKTPMSSAGAKADDVSLQSKTDVFSSHTNSSVPLHRQAAAPPAYLFILPLIPISVATYVAATRYSDFRHHGFDIIFGSLMGIVSSSISFRMYHLPVRRGAGWSWGPRSKSKAFGIRMGIQEYAELGESGREMRDLERGQGSSETPLASSNR